MVIDGEYTGADQTVMVVPDLMRYLPRYYDASSVMQTMQGVYGEELGKVQYAINEVLRQFFVETATWALDIWESELGIITDPGQSYEKRREIIKARLRGFGTVTKEMIKNTAAVFSGGEVDVIEYPEAYRFVVQFVGTKGIPPNMEGVIKMLEDIKPAHLTYSFKYTYTLWETLQGLIWNQASNKTWNEIRLYEGV